MVPQILVGAIAAVGFLGYKFGRECSACHKRLKWTHSCMKCEKVICGNCGVTFAELYRDRSTLRQAGIACPRPCATEIKQQDAETIEAHDTEQLRLAKRRNRIAKVRLVSVNYGGPQKPTKNSTITTGWHRERSDAEEEAREMAVDYYDCDTVWYVKALSEQTKGTSEKGRTYYYREWQITGEV